jgi:ABC-type phosphate/phosphonate transport system substrate-binding protein
MCRMRQLMVVFVMLLSSVGSALAADPTWPKELTFALLSTESAPEIGRRWAPVLEQLSKDLGLPVKDVASTNLPDIQQMTREGKIPRGAVRVIWVSKLIPNDPIVVRKDLPDSLKQAIQQSLTTMKAKNPEVFVAGGAWIGGFVKVDDAAYQIIRDLNETTKRLAALK